MTISIKQHNIYVDGKRVPFKETPNRGDVIKVTDQVLHNTASGITPGGDISWLTNRAARASAHTVIDRDGNITQLMQLNRKTWHAGRSRYRGRSGCNSFTIGHEIDNPGFLRKRADGLFDGIGGPYKPEDVIEQYSAEHGGQKYWLKFTDAQLKTTIELVVAIHNHYDLRSVTTHYEISPGRKTDPGPHFPYDKLQSLLDGRGDYEPVTDDSGLEIDGYVRARSGLNVRRWPSPISTKVGRLPNGTGVQIVRSGTWEREGRAACWYLVQVGDIEGWVHGGYVELI